MVHDIACYIGKNETVDVFTCNTLTDSYSTEQFNIYKWNKKLCFQYLGISYLPAALKFLFRYHVKNATKIRTLFSFLAMGYMDNFVEDYDVVHIHGCSAMTAAAIECCKRHNVPFVVTLHGLNSFDDSVALENSMKKYERDFFKEAYQNRYPLTFISSGNIATVAKFLNAEKTPDFHLVSNGCAIERRKQTIDIRAQYGISKDDFVFVFVGNISKNKNQIQAVRAFAKAFSNGKHKLMFVGLQQDDVKLAAYVKETNLEDRIILCGGVPKEEVANYYMAANATILTSISEGFGLSIVEGFVYGKPNITFSDLPAAKDLYTECAMLNAKSRSDEDLAVAMVEMTKRHWNAEAIMQHAQKFSLDAMAVNYIEVLKNAAQRR